MKKICFCLAALMALCSFNGCNQTTEKHAILDTKGLKLAENGLDQALYLTLEHGSRANTILKKEDALEMLGIATSVTSVALSKDYDENEIAANRKYRDKTLLVTGKVKHIREDFYNIPRLSEKSSILIQSIDKNARSIPLLTLNGHNMFENVTARFTQGSDLTHISKGQNVRIVCNLSDASIIGVSLENCALFSSYLSTKTKELNAAIPDIIRGNTAIHPKIDTIVKFGYFIGKHLPEESSCLTDSYKTGITKTCEKDTQQAFMKGTKDMQAKIWQNYRQHLPQNSACFSEPYSDPCKKDKSKLPQEMQQAIKQELLEQLKKEEGIDFSQFQR